MFITPRVVENETDVRRIIDDLRRRMETLDGVFPIKGMMAPPSAAPANPLFPGPINPGPMRTFPQPAGNP
jgi:hypothetical protein